MAEKLYDFFVKDKRIMERSTPRFHWHVDLERNTLFENLVDLYLPIFKVHWYRLSWLTEMYKVGADVADVHRWAAAVYVSAWFNDLYVLNRRICLEQCLIVNTDLYDLNPCSIASEYDLFLCALSAQIRPTYIKSTFMDTVYVPINCRELDEDADNGNFLNIDGWEMDVYAFRNIVNIMKRKKIMSFEPLSRAITGRPGWLFDWHDDERAYAWFPMEGNYTLEDVAIAYIVGCPCSPKLGPCDRDEWQQFPGNIVPTHIKKMNDQRVRELTFFGSGMARVIETKQQSLSEAVIEVAKSASIVWII